MRIRLPRRRVVIDVTPIPAGAHWQPGSLVNVPGAEGIQRVDRIIHDALDAPWAVYRRATRREIAAKRGSHAEESPRKENPR